MNLPGSLANRQAFPLRCGIEPTQELRATVVGAQSHALTFPAVSPPELSVAVAEVGDEGELLLCHQVSHSFLLRGGTLSMPLHVHGTVDPVVYSGVSKPVVEADLEHTLHDCP